MNDNSTTHQNYGENLYVPPTIHQNKDDLSTQASQIDSDALRAQHGDQAGMANPSVPQGKPKKLYEVYYHQPGEEFAPPSSQNQSHEVKATAAITTNQANASGAYVPLFPEKEANNPFNNLRAPDSYKNEKYIASGCNNCNRCAECSLRRDRELKKNPEDGCTCCMRWCLLISCGLCIAVFAGENTNTSDLCPGEAKKAEDPYRY